MSFDAGSLVKARGRDWVVLPRGDDLDILRLRPLGAPDSDAVGLSLALEGGDICAATLALPDPRFPGDHVGTRLLRDAARLAFRNGAAPLRSLAHVNLDPRPYQLVPLLMALRLDPVRLLLGDDVGVGKTIEAGLIARELLDRGEIRRIAVLCPAALCEQWQRELWDKFHIRANVVRPGSVAALERELDRTGRTAHQTIFDGPGHLVCSIDFIKSDIRRDAFVRGCPEFVIVDEAHGAARAGGQGGAAQQQRFALIQLLAQKRSRHIVLATATPHSGDQGAFASLVGLLRPDLEAAVEATGEGGAPINPALRTDLSRHVILRRRDDVRSFAARGTSFPKRENAEITYALGAEELAILRDTVVACQTYVGAGGLRDARQTIRFWAALALLRCVASSPDAALAALDARLATAGGTAQPAPTVGPLAPAVSGTASGARIDADRVFDVHDDDAVPTLDDGGATTSVLRQFRALRDRIDRHRSTGDPGGKPRDTKLARLLVIVEDLVRRGHNPIIFCRYLATASYVADALRARTAAFARAGSFPATQLGVECITGDTPPDDRVRAIEAIAGTGGNEPSHPRRILVATDCLSEGINLQHGFDAVIHYDMAWNLTRHDQRAGRVDRFGQPVGTVRVVLLHGENNALDKAVLRVWMRRAASIAATLGVSVPVPFNAADLLSTVFEDVLHARATQLPLTLPDGAAALHRIGTLAEASGATVDIQWADAEAKVRRQRGHFVQDAIRPEFVLTTIAATEAALGAPADLERFVHDATMRLTNLRLKGPADEPTINLAELPVGLRGRLDLPEPDRTREVKLTFDAARARPGVQVVTRTHPIVSALAGYLLDLALADPEQARARRAGATRTTAVTTRTALVLLRSRTMLAPVEQVEGGLSLLAEEAFYVGVRGDFAHPEWLTVADATALALSVVPSGNLDDGARTRQVEAVIAHLASWQPRLDRIATDRAQAICASFDALRTATTGGSARAGRGAHRATPTLPADILAIQVLVPEPRAGGMR